MQSNERKHYSILERQSYYLAQCRDNGLFQLNVSVNDLSFWELHALLPKHDCPDLVADGAAELTVYYMPDEDDEGRAFINLRFVTTIAPLVFVGEESDYIVGAAVDILPELTIARREEIKDKAERALDRMAGEAQIDVAMWEAA